MRWVALSSLVVVLAAACGNDVEVSSSAPPPDAGVPAKDIRVRIPAADPAFFDVVTPEVTIGAGQEKMYCYYITVPNELAMDYLVGLQGGGGHHMSLMTTSVPRPAGTIEDCTSAESNAPLRWFVLITQSLPAGYAVDVPAGQQLVVQFHYINALDTPILVRDVARFHLVDPTTVATWVATMVSSYLDFSIPPGVPTSVTWDCALDEDRQLLELFGHMHELGLRMEIDIDGGAQYIADPWQSGFRDTPPATTFFGAPISLAAGTMFHSTCAWLNGGTNTVVYPSEMCLTFAYLGGSKTPAQCN